MKSKSWLAASCLLMMMACADAALLVGGTRVIFDQQHAQATVQISNSGQRPLLAQMWIDRGNEGARLDEIDVPFAITPTVVRLEPGKGQTVRVLQIANGMPADRESLFWFNALEVPPRAEQAHGGQIMEFALRTRMKLFYRPRACE
ncbi:fimbrial biogenesis chaperone [Diaphorobacter aerolatus]|uniref:Fimbria/pilus periplasmic chaperone n=1 Tax=Diaphorobacter aerolatus TaxID=1288495 RepID=A0A7H0GHD8_9BURK|nr:fimbria/pilus periplasmic chaperone [Diaphorobacter aerolatus]QNP47704.1 fimbria/pilus periplasmic chaperone [Diaphorobacter aerolatus]